MARKIKDIQAEMFIAKEDEVSLVELTSTSKTAIWRLLIYIVAYAIFTLELLLDKHRIDIEDILRRQQPHTPRWYRDKSLNFQYGYDLIVDSDEYDNNNLTEAEIEASKIIKYCAVTESDIESRLIIKIATESGGVLKPVTTTQINAFRQYIKEVRDAGVRITILNNLPDIFAIKLRVKYDPLLLDAMGMVRLTGAFPVVDAIHEFLKELPFDGELSVQKFEEKILAVPGVIDLALDLAESAWIDADAVGVTNYGGPTPIDISVIPKSGYFTINLDEDNEYKSVIEYV